MAVKQVGALILNWFIMPLVVAVLTALGLGPEEWAERLVANLRDWATPAVLRGAVIALAITILVSMLLPRMKRCRKRRGILLRAEDYVEHTDGRLRYVQEVCAERKSPATWYKKLNTQQLNLSDVLRDVDTTCLSPKQIQTFQRLQISHRDLDETISELIARQDFTPEHAAHLYKHRAEKLGKSLNDFIESLAGYFHNTKLVKSPHVKDASYPARHSRNRVDGR